MLFNINESQHNSSYWNIYLFIIVPTANCPILGAVVENHILNVLNFLNEIKKKTILRYSLYLL